MLSTARNAKIGYELPVISKSVTVEDCQNYRGWPWIWNWHTREDIARELGFPGVLMPGIMGVTYISELCSAFFGDNWCTNGELSIAFIGTVCPPEVVQIGGIVRELREEGERKKIIMEVWLKKANGNKALSGTVSAYI